jgi:hypothetical protein
LIEIERENIPELQYPSQKATAKTPEGMLSLQGSQSAVNT